MKTKKKFKRFIWPAISLVLTILFFSVGLVGIIHYNGPLGNSNISAYDFVTNNAKQTGILDIESAQMLEKGNTQNSEYLSKIMVSNARLKEGQSTSITVILEAILIVFIIILIFDLALSLMKLFPFYKNNFNVAILTFKIVEFVFSVLTFVLIKNYLGVIGSFGASCSVGFSCYMAIILGVAGIVLAIIFGLKRANKINGKK